MFAIIEIGGKQYKVAPKDIIRVEKVAPETAKVLLIADEKTTKIGVPFLNEAQVELKVLKTAKGDKVRTFKIKPKKRYKRLKGHRQIYSEMEVIGIK